MRTVLGVLAVGALLSGCATMRGVGRSAVSEIAVPDIVVSEVELYQMTVPESHQATTTWVMVAERLKSCAKLRGVNCVVEATIYRNNHAWQALGEHLTLDQIKVSISGASWLSPSSFIFVETLDRRAWGDHDTCHLVFRFKPAS